MKNVSSIILALSILAIITTGCATIFKGSDSSLNLSSQPSGARVFINGNDMGKTPITLKLKSNQQYNIRFEKPGYDPVTYTVGTTLGAGWVVLDILAGGIPIIVDAVTGAWYYLDKEQINAVFSK